MTIQTIGTPRKALRHDVDAVVISQPRELALVRLEHRHLRLDRRAHVDVLERQAALRQLAFEFFPHPFIFVDVLDLIFGALHKFVLAFDLQLRV